MIKKLMSLGLVGILSASLMIGCDSSNDKDDDTITIKHVDENGNTIKKEKVTKEEAKQIEENQNQNQNQKQQTTKDKTTKDNNTKKEITKDNKQPNEDPTTNNYNYDEELYGNAMLGTCPDCGRNGMVFNGGNGLKCAYCGFYDAYYYADDEPAQDINDSNKDDEYTPDDYNDYDETQDYEESPSEPVEDDMN